jgi:glycosyltransferase involved in cell wall biosynthesis
MFTVVVPSFNRRQQLLSLLDSLDKQTHPNFEVIIVDDGSDIALYDIKKNNYKFQLKILRNSANMGQAHCRNRGIKNAANDWIAFLDDDDIFDNTKLEKLKSHIERCVKKPDIIYHKAKIVMINEKCEYLSRSSRCQDYFKNLLIENIVGGTPMVIINKSLINRCGYFDESLFALEDYEYWLRAAKYGAEFLYIDDPLTICKYRTKSNSVSKNVKNAIEAFDSISNLYKKEIQSLSPNLKRKRIAWFNATLGLKHLYNYRRVQAAKHFIMAFFLTSSFKYLIVSLLSLVSPKLLFFVRSKIRTRALGF